MNYESDRETAKAEKKKALRRLIFRIGVPVSLVIIFLIVMLMSVGINDAGRRTVVQWPNGTLFVKFTPGIYFKFFGSYNEYGDFATFDFDRSDATGGATLNQPGISVRYQDGGMGTVFGKSRYSLPSDEETMLKLHKAFMSHRGVAEKLIKPVTEEAMNLTAGLMNSEDAYATKRAIFTSMAKEQVAKGKYVTILKTTGVEDAATGKTIYKEVPVIKRGDDGQPMHLHSDLETYGVQLAGFQLNDPGFEKRTQQQIADKREATMAIITAKANAERAKQEAVTAEEKGKALVIEAQYKKEVEKEAARVDAERIKQVAIIEANQKVEVAEQQKLEALVVATRKVEVAAQFKLEAEQRKLAAGEYKLEQILIGEGDGERKRLVMEADGALEQKLDTYRRVMFAFAEEFGKQKWVPDVQMGATGEGGNEASNLINLLTANSLKDLGLNMKMVNNQQ